MIKHPWQIRFTTKEGIDKILPILIRLVTSKRQTEVFHETISSSI